MALASFAACAVPSVASGDASVTKAAIVFGSCPQKPAWPEAALQEKRDGSVVLVFEVDADNTVLDAQVKSSSGHPDLDEAARAGLAKCAFRAATRNGTPVRDWAQVTYKWKLE
jgi:TonB family protein